MDLTLARVLMFGLSLAGIPLLVFAIKLIRGVFTEEIVAELPYTQKEAPFSITTAGTYAIWQKAPLLARTPVGEFRPEVRSSPSGRPLRLRVSWMRPSVNNGMTGRMELFRFFAPAGDYTIAFGEDPYRSRLHSWRICFGDIGAPVCRPGRRCLHALAGRNVLFNPTCMDCVT
jgi:hypothetical protein